MAKTQNPGELAPEAYQFQLTFEPSAFFSSIKDAFIKIKDGSKGSIIESVAAGVFKTFVPETSVENRAYTLLYRAMLKACLAVFIEDEEIRKIIDETENLAAQKADFNAQANALLHKVTIERGFFLQPQAHPFVKGMQQLYQSWMQQVLGLSDKQSDALCQTLPGKFLRELALEWETHPSDYEPIQGYFQNPFIEALQEEKKWQEYNAQLISMYAQPVFGDVQMSLADIYIEPDFRVHRRCVAEKDGSDYIYDEDDFVIPKNQGNLHQYLLELLNGKNPLNLEAEQSNFVLLLGQPGQGKTSFCKRTIFQLLTEHPNSVKRVFFVRLRDISDVKALINEPLEVIAKEIAGDYLDTFEPLKKSDFKDCLLILDGLDELFMHQGLTNSDIKNLITNLSKLKNIHLLVTTRYNYIDIQDLSGTNQLVLRLNEFDLAQQKEWLRRYKSKYECQLDEVKLEEIYNSEDERFKDLKNLVNQPILLQIVAKADFKIDEQTNRAKLYEELFDTLLKRKWASDGQLDKYRNLDEKDFRQLLQNIAIHIFHSEFEYVRRADFENEGNLKKTVNRLARKMRLEQLDIKDLLKDILVSFYFKNVAKNADDRLDDDRHQAYAIEFYHKSLQEYLVAEKIWYFFKEELVKKEEDDWEGALESVFELLSPKMITTEIREYLIQIIENDKEASVKKDLIIHLKGYLAKFIEHDFLFEYQAEKSTRSNPINAAQATFFGYWKVLSHLGITENIIPATQQQRFADLVRSFSVLNWMPLNLLKTDLLKADLLKANLREANLREANLREAVLSKAVLSKADLFKADLFKADLLNADLRNAVLCNADLRNAVLSYADLREANLFRAVLSYTVLSKAVLRNATFHYAILSYADLFNADLSYADFSYADLSYADLSYADLRNADLFKADLRNAVLRNADLRNSDLFKADLRNAVLYHADLKNTDFTNAIIDETTRLEGVKNIDTAIFTGTIYEGKLGRTVQEEEA
ncbi:MAG: pentapeptide repeat-containing protein [Saprospiraceae bacterium]|nr:pentapeptide repeat-containing protein [Saprospiraceae bacterium]